MALLGWAPTHAVDEDSWQSHIDGIHEAVVGVLSADDLLLGEGFESVSFNCDGGV